MSDDTSAQPTATQPADPPSGAAAADNTSSKPAAPVADEKADGSADIADEAKTGNKDESEDKDAEPGPSAPANEDVIMNDGDVEMEDKPADPTADSETAAKPQPRRKSTAGTDKSKKLSRKASKAKILHVDAKPGDHYFAKLKGFPPWPVVICEEGMLPRNMANSRPVTAARADGTYREDFADGAKRVGDRTFPVMYLHTNEFSWIPNTDLTDLDPATVGQLITAKMRKDLQAAHELAAKGHDLDYYKEVLQEFEEQRLANLEEQRLANLEEERLASLETKKSKPKTPRKSSKVVDEEGDLEMDDLDDEVEEPAKKKAKSNKRKAADENNTLQRADSVKKPKIKLTGAATPKSANGIESSATKDSAKASKAKKPAKTSAAKASTAKSGAAKEVDSKKEKEPVAASQSEMTPEERRVRKEKEILFLRHRLQRGLLPREGQANAAEMKQISEFLAKLETFPNLDVSIIRATKINKVLKAILKLETIPREDEFHFKPRSQVLLDKWNILLASDAAPAPAASSSANANGVNGTAAVAKDSKEMGNGKADSEKNAAEPQAEDEDDEPIGNKDAAIKDKSKDETADTEKPTEKEAAAAEMSA
ncbi:hypothetical protein GGR50DRAFT_697099 [Xylaria sp. CBS 124048]|nr:hypothetical protein GGR50DRAFT_697099 [Xylaria sp. CBS 124048]